MKGIKSVRLIGISFIILILLFSGCTFTLSHRDHVEPINLEKGEYDLAEEYLTEFIQSKMKKTKSVGLSIAVVSDNEIIYEEGFGYADLENEIEVTSKTIFRVGSISKIFTVISALQLQEKGLLNIDNDIREYIPEFSMKNRFNNESKITLRSIMTHHSGLPSDYLKEMLSDSPISYEELVTELQDYYYASEPNVVLSYSNLAMTLLGYVVERVSQEKFTEYTEKNIFIPLGMHNSAFRLEEDMDPYLSYGYMRRDVYEQYDTFAVPAGLLYSNAEDMGRFIIAMINHGKLEDAEIISQATFNEMTRVQNSDIPLDLGNEIGLGWFLDAQSLRGYEGKIIQHGGDWEDFHAQLTILPDDKLGVIVMTNSSSGAGIVREIASEALKVYLKVKSGFEFPVEEEEEKIPVVKIDGEKFKKYEGYYSLIPGMGTFKCEVKGDKIRVSIAKYKGLLESHPDDWFSVKMVLLKLFRFKITEFGQVRFGEINGQTVIFQKVNDVESVMAIKIFPEKVTEEIWLNREGKYEPVNIEEDEGTLSGIEQLFNLEIVDGILCIAGFQPIEVLDKNTACVMGIGRNKGDALIFQEEDGIEYLYYSGYKLKKKD